MGHYLLKNKIFATLGNVINTIIYLFKFLFYKIIVYINTKNNAIIKKSCFYLQKNILESNFPSYYFNAKNKLVFCMRQSSLY